MQIRQSTIEDLGRIMEIYAVAREFMAAHGNPNQWGPTNWPPEQLIRQDIRDCRSFVCLDDDGRIVGTFFFACGSDIEPTYRAITDGGWAADGPYGVVHRLAGDGSERGIGAFCLNWAFERCGHLRIDTHGDNLVMQNLLRKLGFAHCGTIYVEEDDYPRLAFEKVTEDSDETPQTPPKRVVVGMSGGVDSSVAAALLLRAGYEVVGVTCDFVGTENDCCAAADAHAVCEVLGIRHIHEDCTARFAETVVEPFCGAYAAGLTPSPCVGCNATMKLPALAAIADELGFAFIATGHYARMGRGENDRAVVLTAADSRKDQSYMLASVPPELLSRLVLPLGGMTKAQVRALAEELGLPVAHRPDSQDICFAPNGYRALLAEHDIRTAPGPIRNTAGRVLGTHTGLADYTIGQRGGLRIGGAPEPYYVLAKDAAENALTVGFAAEARMTAALVEQPLWQAFAALPEEPFACTVKLRYRSRAVPCSIEKALSFSADSAQESRASDMIRVTLEEPQPLTAPGQFAVFYSGDTVLGSGIIAAVIRG